MAEIKEEMQVPYKALDEFTYEVLVRVGVPPGDAHIITDVLSQTNLRGVETHGTDMLPNYVERLSTGVLNPKPNVQIVKETSATALIDGDHGLGQVTSVFGMKVAIKKAREVGIGWVNIFNSGHQGALAYYSLMAAAEDMIGIATTTTSRVMSPWASREPIATNSPIAFAVPTRSYKTVVLDMATSVLANGKVRLAQERNIPLPEGMTVDEQGNITTDPFKVASILSVGTYKGSGLAMMFAILAGLLSGAPLTAYHTTKLREDGPFVADVGHLLVVVDVGNFTDLNGFKSQLDDVITTWKSSAKRPGFDKLYYPGEIEWDRVPDRQRNGIPLNDTLVDKLRKIADELEIEFPSPA